MDFNALFSQLSGKDEKLPLDFQELFEQIAGGKATDGDNPMKDLLGKLQYLQAAQAVNVEPDPEVDEFIDSLNGACVEGEDEEFIESLNAEV